MPEMKMQTKKQIDMGKNEMIFREKTAAEIPVEPVRVWSGRSEAPPGWTTQVKIMAIASPEELAWVARQVNGVPADGSGQTSGNAFEGTTICLTADVDLGGREWEPIGCDLGHPFKGRFDGCGHRILGLAITREGVKWAGLFGFTYFKARISNVAVLGCRVQSVVRSGLIAYAGAVCAYGYGDILNCCASGSVSTLCQGRTATASGIGGANLIRDCYAVCRVEAVGAMHALAGGISAQFTEIVACYSTGRVQALSTGLPPRAFAGGIGSHINNTDIVNCLSLNKEGISVAGNGLQETVGRIFGAVWKLTFTVQEKNYASPLVVLQKKNADTLEYKSPRNHAGQEDGNEWNGLNYAWSAAFDCTTDPLHLPLLRTTDGRAYVGGKLTQPAAGMLKMAYLPAPEEPEGN